MNFNKDRGCVRMPHVIVREHLVRGPAAATSAVDIWLRMEQAQQRTPTAASCIIIIIVIIISHHPSSLHHITSTRMSLLESAHVDEGIDNIVGRASNSDDLHYEMQGDDIRACVMGLQSKGQDIYTSIQICAVVLRKGNIPNKKTRTMSDMGFLRWWG